MIIKLDLTIDISKLTAYLDYVQKTNPPFMKKNGPWGGWSITSSTGEINDGWQTGEKINDSNISEDEKNKLKEFFSTTKFDKPTPIYNEYIEELLISIKQSFPTLSLTRLRIALLKPHPESTSYWHQDGEIIKGQRAFRLHIPIVTNENCFFEYQHERHHLKADGSIYLIEINQLHRALNLSDKNRYHLIADVSQKLGI